MNDLEKLIYFLQDKMIEPKPFGWFHMLCLFLGTIIIFILFKNKKNYDEKQLKIVLFVYGSVALILEILKQIIWSFNYNEINNIVV